MPRQGHRGRDGDDRARLRARTAAALARARLAVRAAGRACVSPSRPGVLALALRLALEWLYLYDGGSVDQRGLPFSMCCEVGRRCKSAGFSTGFPQFAQCFVRAHTAVSSLCGSIYQINFLKRPGHLFKGGGVQRQSLWPRSAERGIPLYAHKSAGGGLRGNPRRGFPLNFSSLSTCAPIRWAVVDGLSCLSTPFLWCLPKETVSSRQRKALFYPGGSTIRVSAAASVDGTHLRPTWGGAWWLTGRSSQLDAVGGDVGASSPWERRVGPNSYRGGTQKRVSLGLHPISLRKSKEMGWNGQQGAAAFDQ